MDVPVTIASETAIARQNVAFSTMKQSADNDEVFAKVIESTIKSAPVSETRGTNVDFAA